MHNAHDRPKADRIAESHPENERKEREMKKVKKIFAALLALTMVLGMGVTTFAAPHKPVATDKATVKIENVESGATYNAYQIIDATYNDNGFTGYVWAPGTGKTGAIKIKGDDKEAEGLTQVEGLTGEMISRLAKDPSGLTIKKVPFDPISAQLEVGTWMILVTPSEENPTKSYNPMIVSVYYALTGTGQENDQVAGSVDAGQSWKLEATKAYMKSNNTENQEDKTVTKPTDEVNKVVEFTLTGVIPSYSKEYYTKPVYELTDTIQNGLEYVTKGSKDADEKVGYANLDQAGLKGAMTVTPSPDVTDLAGKITLTDNDYTITYTPAAGDTKESFKISFAPTFIQSVADKTEAQRKVTVTYYAKITDDAITQLGKNEFKITYSNGPGENQKAETKGDDEYVYTLSLDGVLKKVKEDKNALPGATFTLYTDEALTEATAFDTSEATGGDGNIQFKGLDGDKTYYLRETTAPAGYSLNATVYKIEFPKGADYRTYVQKDGKDTNQLLTYKVKVTPGTVGEDEKIIWETDTTKIHTSEAITYGTAANLSAAYEIVDTKLSSLPSTGGIGTTIFTIGGCALMIIAAGLYFATRRKNAK